jgi:chromosomal replication initiator protein
MLETLWTQMLADLETRISQATLDSWLRPCRLATLDGDLLHVAAPNKFIQNWLAQNHTRLLEGAAARILGGEPRVVFEVDSGLAEEAPARPTPGPSPATGLSPRYTFDAFVVGNSNQFAQAACQAVAQLPSKAYNPLFIYGGVGLGKTHLLHAVGHQIHRQFPSMRLLYISTERSGRRRSSSTRSTTSTRPASRSSSRPTPRRRRSRTSRSACARASSGG